jgi:hypothetical protein
VTIQQREEIVHRIVGRHPTPTGLTLSEARAVANEIKSALVAAGANQEDLEWVIRALLSPLIDGSSLLGWKDRALSIEALAVGFGVRIEPVKGPGASYRVAFLTHH